MDEQLLTEGAIITESQGML